MFEDNNINDFDRMMKSILDEGREEVPAGVWEGVSEGLDKAARKKAVVLWLRRSAVGTAVAAALAAGIFFEHGNEDLIVPDNGENRLIAVVDSDDNTEDISVDGQDESPAEVKMHRLMMAVADTEETTVYEHIKENIIPQDASEAVKVAEKTAEPVKVAEKTAEPAEDIYFPEDWGEEDEPRKRNISLVLSGIAGTNSAKNNSRIGPMKSPSSAAPQKTGITETSSKSIYGIPLSAGAGVKIGINERWSLGIGANYTYLNRKFYGKYTQVDGNGNIINTTSSDIRNSQHYIGIPVNVFCNILGNEHLNFYAYAGATAEKCISDRYDVLNTRYSHKEQVKGIQMSVNAGIGMEFMLGRHLGLYIDPSLRYYFDNGQPKNIRTTQPLMLGFEMGFRARL